MASIIQFQTDFGPVSIEADDSLARELAGSSSQSSWVSKGASPMKAKGVGGDILVEAEGRLEEAMSSLTAYVATLQSLVERLDLRPREVAVEIGLKMTGSAGFIIAKAGAETEMKVSLTWEPRSRDDLEAS